MLMSARVRGRSRTVIPQKRCPARTRRLVTGLFLAVALSLVVSSSLSAAGAARATVTELYGTAPDFLDPQQSYTTEGAEALWVSYLGLYSYDHRGGAASSELIPALASGQPRVTDGGRLYTMTLRPGLVYSNGAAVRAGDFLYSIERALKLNFGGAVFYTNNIVGAAAYLAGKARTISGISFDDATGRITIRLLAPYGPFENVLAFPSSGFVPAGTPMRSLTNDPPPGVGPYEITDVVPNRSWLGEVNPYYARQAIPGIPVGTVNVQAKVVSNTTTESEDVLDNSADLFDNWDSIAPALVPAVRARASRRYRLVPTESLYYFFMNTTSRPFNNQLVREAVVTATDRRVLSKLDSGTLIPACYLLPIGLIGHPTAPCPYGNPDAAPNVARARELIRQSGDAGAAVAVWGEERQPEAQFAIYYASVLNEIGLKATLKPIADAQYFPVIANLRYDPQTGWAGWAEDFPNPSDFYALLDRRAIQPTNNGNFSQVDDARIQGAIEQLDRVPASDLRGVANKWAALDEYTARKAYEDVFGYLAVPEFASSRIDFQALRFVPNCGWDWTSFRLAR
jgi:peptide/nickel transport system substrate-binding protein